jgi:hypothetical protein
MKSMRPSGRITPLLALALVGILFQVAEVRGQTTYPARISSISVAPAGSIQPTDLVWLYVLLTADTSEIQLYQASHLSISNYTVTADVWARSGSTYVPDQRTVTFSLGTLDPGTYQYRVTQRGPTFNPSPVTGHFTVLPEPVSLALLAIGALLLRRRRR